MPKPRPRRAARARSWRDRLRAANLARGLLDPWLGSLALLLTLIALESYVWLGALLAELRLQLALLAGIAAAWALWQRRWLRAGGLLVTGLWCGAFVLPYLRSARPTPQHGPVLQVVQLHLAEAALGPEPLQRLVREQRPDLISLTGVRAGDLDALTPLPGYRRLPHAEHALLWARAELSPQPGVKGAGLLRVGGCGMGVTQVVLPSLFAARAQAARAAGVAALVRAELSARHVVLGSLGARSEAADLRVPLRAHALRDARLGHGLLATFPAALGPLGLPVDQLLVRGWLLVREAHTLAPLVPAAHRALASALELTEPRCAQNARAR